MNVILNGVVAAVMVFMINHNGYGPTGIALTCGIAAVISFILGKTSK